MSDAVNPLLRNVIEALTRLPGLGVRSAERIADHLLRRPREEVLELAEAVKELRTRLQCCEECFNLSDQPRCAICRDERRDRTRLCVVEQPRDLWAIERAGLYEGLYHVLGGRLSPLDGLAPADLTFEALRRRVEQGSFRELILATNPTVEGDGTALYCRKLFEDREVRLTQLGRGLPTGGTLQHASRAMLTDAFRDRRQL